MRHSDKTERRVARYIIKGTDSLHRLYGYIQQKGQWLIGGKPMIKYIAITYLVIALLYQLFRGLTIENMWLGIFVMISLYVIHKTGKQYGG